MPRVTIPTTNTDLDYSQTTELDGTVFVFRFQYNTRSGYWYVSIADVDEVPILSSQKVVSRVDLLYGVTDPRRPAGVIVCIDINHDLSEPTLASFGTDHVLHYVT